MRNIKEIHISLNENLWSVAEAIFDDGFEMKFDPCSFRDRAEVLTHVTKDTKFKDERFPESSFSDYVKDRDKLMKEIAKTAAKIGKAYDPIVMGIVSAINVHSDGTATLAFAYGGCKEVSWTEEGLRDFMPGINGYTVFFDER